MKKCKNCGFETNSDAKFCNKCGSPMEEIKKYCSNCGSEISEKAEFCAQCGAPSGNGTQLNRNENTMPNYGVKVEGSLNSNVVEHSAIHEYYIWMLVIIPVVLVVIGLILGFTFDISIPTYAYNGLYIALVIMDYKLVKASDVRVGIPFAVLGIIIAPAIYIFAREAKTNKNWVPAIISIIVTAVSFVCAFIAGFLGAYSM